MSHWGQRGMQILLVEDDKEVAESVADALAVLGHSVSHASSVVEALKLIDVTCPNVAVLDVDLGGGTSADVASVLNERSIPLSLPAANLEPIRRLRWWENRTCASHI